MVGCIHRYWLIIVLFAGAVPARAMPTIRDSSAHGPSDLIVPSSARTVRKWLFRAATEPFTRSGAHDHGFFLQRSDPLVLVHGAPDAGSALQHGTSWLKRTIAQTWGRGLELAEAPHSVIVDMPASSLNTLIAFKARRAPAEETLRFSFQGSVQQCRTPPRQPEGASCRLSLAHFTVEDRTQPPDVLLRNKALLQPCVTQQERVWRVVQVLAATREGAPTPARAEALLRDPRLGLGETPRSWSMSRLVRLLIRASGNVTAAAQQASMPEEALLFSVARYRGDKRFRPKLDQLGVLGPPTRLAR